MTKQSNQFAEAIEKNDFETARKLIAENKNNLINQPDSEGHYPLHITTNFSLYNNLSIDNMKNFDNVAKVLLNKGANPNVADPFGSYPIHYAAIHGNLELLMQLIEFGADYNIPDAANETALHQAIRRKHNNIVKYLIERPDIHSTKTLEGDTPVNYAERYHFVVLSMVKGKLGSLEKI